MKFTAKPYVPVILILTLWISFECVKGQSIIDSDRKLNDTMKTLSLDELYKIILNNHPIVRQAGLLSEMAQQEVRLARGSFDPKLASSFEHKEFENKTYYSKLDAYVNFPTWFPVNPKVGYQYNSGALLNSEDAIPGGKQLYAGVSIPIGRGLFTDERRTAVKQARLFNTIATADQLKIINKVLLDAAKGYWQWYYGYNQYLLSTQAIVLADEVYSRVKINVEQGEAASVDTIQARVTLQSRRVDRQEAWLVFQNSGIEISNFLWDGQGNPVQLDAAIIPALYTEYETVIKNELLEDLVMRAKVNHPELIKLNTKLTQLDIEKSLAKEFLKPQLDLNYSVLSQPSAPQNIDFLNDYKAGLEFSFPIFLRKERSKIAITKLKIESTNFQLNQLERTIINEINSVFNELVNTRIIITQQEDVVDLYSRLLKAELLNLENGESDLFKINIQQEKLLQSQSKLLKLKSEFQKQLALLYWSAGTRISSN